jgi:hypothetical protein
MSERAAFGVTVWRCDMVRTIGVAIVMLSIGSAGSAQSTSGSINGSVVDPAGALLPGVIVTITSERTGLVYTRTTGAGGDYALSSLPPDVYTVTAVLTGFKSARRSGVTLTVDQRLQIDFTLSVGDFAEQVEVRGQAPILQTQSASTGELISQRQIQDLPLLGRNFLELTRLTAGTASGSGGNTLDLSVNGQREFGNSVMVDGVEVTGNRNNDTGVRPSLDAVQEFKIVTSAYAPEFGRAAGGVVAIQTRSGANAFRGTASEFFRPTAMAARSFFSTEKPRLKQHNFGGTLGGPLRQNRTFFFGAYEGIRHKDRYSYLDSVPPRDQIRVLQNGDVDLSGLVDPFTGQMVPVFDPAAYAANFVAQPFPGNVIPADRVSPAGLAVLQRLFPAPNRPGTNNGWLNNFAVNQSFAQDFDTFDGRVDHAVRDGDRLSVIYHLSTQQSTTADRFAGVIPIEGGGSGDSGERIESANHSASATWTHVFGSRLVSESRVAYSHFRLNQLGIVPTGGLADQLGFANLRVPGNEATDGLPSISLGFGGYTGGSTFKPLRFLDRNLQATGTLSGHAGRHDLKLGVDVRRLTVRPHFSLFPTGYFYFGGAGQSLTGDPDFGYFDPGAFYSNGGSDIADLLLGLPTSVTMGLQLTSPRTRSWEGHAFAQDVWRLTSRLTLMYGARYEYQAPFAEAGDAAANFDPEAFRLLLAGRGGNSSGLIQRDRNNIAPRAGVAWQFADRTVLRGGWGLFYSPENDGRSDVLTKNYPFALLQDFANSPYGGLPFTYVLDSGIPRQSQVAVPAGGDIPIADVPSARGQAFFFVDPAIRTGYAQLYNAVLQRELSSNMSAEIGYVGSVSRDLPYGVGNLNLNDRLSSEVGRIEAQFARGRSEYHSIQAKLNRRFSGGLGLLASYTYGRGFDNGPAPFNLGRNNQAPQDPFDLDAEWGPSANDIRHSLVGSFVYELPFWREAVGMRGALGAWQVNGILTARSGLPFNVIRNRDNQAAPGLRPNLVGDADLPRGDRELTRYFDTGAFSAEGLGPTQPGNAGRNILRGPGFVNLDLSIFKTLRIRGDTAAQIRVEAFNLTNTPHFSNPNADLSQGNFGAITGTIGNARIMQFAVRLFF